MPASNFIVAAILLLMLSACEGQQSALMGLTDESYRVLRLSWLMFAGAGLILALVLVAAAIAIFGPPAWRYIIGSNRAIIGLGMVLPIVVLSALLVYGFAVIRTGITMSPDPNAIKISVIGHQWWWQIFYHHADGTTTESANELRIPVGQSIELELTSADVLHSFWVPAYAGKVDMIPGRTNRLRFTATQAGVVRGQCAEYCGGAHALMAFHVVAMAPAEYQDWLQRERGDALPKNGTQMSDGQQLYMAGGCGGCHAIRGTSATGGIGPDLSHFGSRLYLGAGVLANDSSAVARWIRLHRKLKPENKMPTYNFLSEEHTQAIAAYLSGLK